VHGHYYNKDAVIGRELQFKKKLDDGRDQNAVAIKKDVVIYCASLLTVHEKRK